LKEIANGLLNPLYNVLGIIVNNYTEKQPVKLLNSLTERIYENFLNLLKDKSFFGLIKGIMKVACNCFKADDANVVMINCEQNIVHVCNTEVKAYELPKDLLMKKAISVSVDKSIAGNTWDSVKYICSSNGLYVLELCYKNSSIEFDLRPECAHALFKLIEDFTTKLTLLSERVSSVLKNNEKVRMKQAMINLYKHINKEDKSLMSNVEQVGQKVLLYIIT
jgi:hypothetical protein